jgi:hypothetical protein
MLQFEELRRKTTEAKKKKVNGRQERVSKKFATLVSIVRNGTGTNEESESNSC